MYDINQVVILNLNVSTTRIKTKKRHLSSDTHAAWIRTSDVLNYSNKMNTLFHTFSRVFGINKNANYLRRFICCPLFCPSSWFFFFLFNVYINQLACLPTLSSNLALRHYSFKKFNCFEKCQHFTLLKFTLY